MCHASAEAEAICQKNKLSATDLLRPFTTVNAAFTITTVNDPYRLQGFHLRFVHTDELKELGSETADQALTKLLGAYDCSEELREAEKRDLTPPSGPAPPLPPLRSSSTTWIDSFREQLAESLRNSEGASLDHPVGCLLIASAAQPKPVAVFNALLSSANLAPVIAEGVADPSLPRTYVLLHDASDPAADLAAAQKALAEMSRTHGTASCHLLTLNSRAADAPPPKDLWGGAKLDFLSAAPPAGLPADAPLGASDVAALREMVEGPMLQQVLSSLQSRIVALSSTVKAARAGLQNKLRSWLGAGHGKTSGASPNAAGGAGSMRYSCGTIEAQTRQLADCAFLLGDYATALTAYRQAAGEFKGDRAWWHYAAALEMSALCLHMTDGPWRDMDECAEKAAATYLKLSTSAGDRSARHATRAVLLQMEMLAQAPAKKREAACRDVAQALVDQSTQESSLAAALLLEQAALCFRSTRVPMQRKYAFYLILAGYRYISCSQRRHAVRTYATALRVYAGKGWSHIEDHVHFTLGRNCAQLARIELGLAYFLRLLRHSRQPAERQQTFMKELGNILRAHPDKAALPALPLPRFACRTIRVLLNDHNQPSGTQATGLLSALHPLWKPLTAPLLPAAEATTGNWLTGISSTPTAASGGSAAPCVVGEWVFVELEVENPMHVQLALSSLHLDCALARPDKEEGGGEAPGADHPLTAPLSEGGEAVMRAVASEDLETDVQELVLAKGGRALVRLGVRAHREGQLTISGVCWTLNGAAHGNFALELHGRRLNKTRAHRLGKMYEFDQSLSMRVVHPMPLLQAHIEGLPQAMLLGEMVHTTLVVSNVGRTPLCEAKLRISQPAFCVLEDASAAADGAAPAGAGPLGAGPLGATAAGSSEAAGAVERKRSDANASSVARAAAAASAIVNERPVRPDETPPAPALPAAAKLAAERAARQQGGSGSAATSTEPRDYSTMPLPLPGGQLDPGGTLRLKLWVRAAALGAHSLHFVFAYTPTTPAPDLKRRLCPLSARLRVHPSLAVQHAIRPLCGGAGGKGVDVGGKGAPPPEYALSLSVQNVSATRRMRISQISCVSGQWSAAPLCPGASIPSTLQPTEANAVHLRLVRWPAPTDGFMPQAAACMRHCEMLCVERAPDAASSAPGGLIDSRRAPYLDSLLRTAAPAVSETAESSAAAFGRPKRARDLTPSELASTVGLSIIVHWADAEGDATGQVHLTPVLPQPPLEGLTIESIAAAPSTPASAPASALATTSAPARTDATAPEGGLDGMVTPVTAERAESLAGALRVTVESPDKLAHAFTALAVCHVPLKVVVQNCLRRSSIAFTLHTPSDPSGATEAQSLPAVEVAPAPSKRLVSGGCHWLGATRHTEQWLAPSESVTLSLSVAVTAPGTYTLDGFRLTANAWKVQPGASAQRAAAPVACPPPASRAIQVVEPAPTVRLG